MSDLKRQDGMYFVKETIPAKDIIACGDKESFLAILDEKLQSLRRTLGPPLLELLESKGPHLIVVESDCDCNLVTNCQDIVLSATITPLKSWVAKLPAIDSEQEPAPIGHAKPA